jgi:hypothetical protein
MRALVVVLALLALVAGAWLVRDWWLPPSSEPRAADTTSGQGSATPGAQVAAAPTVAPAPDPASGAGRAPAGVASVAAVQQQAERYIATLTEIEVEPVKVEKADHFITSEQMLSLVPQGAVEQTTARRMLEDPTLTPDTPITLVREAEQVERVTPERLIARSGGDLDMSVNVLERDQVRTTTVREVLEQARRAPDKPIDVVTRTEYYEQTTPAELAARNADQQDETVRIIRRHHGLEASSVGDLIRAEGVGKDSLFYVRTVRPQDSQGIWGIVQGGIIDNFARGMAIRRGKEINVYKVDIPKDADERRSNASSSFLGKLIHEKSKASHVYNFNLNRMGRNPDRIYPGQEIVIIDFRPDELIDIYKHFVAQRG